jgi:hypothetical protein
VTIKISLSCVQQLLLLQQQSADIKRKTNQRNHAGLLAPFICIHPHKQFE